MCTSTHRSVKWLKKSTASNFFQIFPYRCTWMNSTYKITKGIVPSYYSQWQNTHTHICVQFIHTSRAAVLASSTAWDAKNFWGKLLSFQEEICVIGGNLFKAPCVDYVFSQWILLIHSLAITCRNFWIKFVVSVKRLHKFSSPKFLIGREHLVHFQIILQNCKWCFCYFFFNYNHWYLSSIL